MDLISLEPDKNDRPGKWMKNRMTGGGQTFPPSKKENSKI